MSGVPLFHVDAFAEGPFTGNPAAVCILPAEREPRWMQAVAREMNLAETAFLVPGEEAWGIRWFSPATEIALCGHATLAAAHVLWETGRLDPVAPARFRYGGGALGARRLEGGPARIALDFPTLPAAPWTDAPDLSPLLGLPVRWTGRSDLDVVVLVERAEDVRALRPDLAGIARLQARGLIVTAAGDVPGLDFVSRFFAPQSGIDEDPVTGSAHCTLGPFWAQRLGRNRLTARQVSPRGGLLEVEVAGDRSFLRGQACTIARGELSAAAAGA